MSQRLQELERALTMDVGEGSSDGERREETSVVKRALSVGLVRKSSITLRRTFGSFRHDLCNTCCALDQGQRPLLGIGECVAALTRRSVWQLWRAHIRAQSKAVVYTDFELTTAYLEMFDKVGGDAGGGAAM
jgi:hypothetical protein